MTTKQIPGGVVHELPTDLKKALMASPKALAMWQDIITPLGRNEWICWVESAKQTETRSRRVGRVVSEILEGIRRPCCWIGCIHRTDKAISPSVQWALSKQSRSR